jgi:hypothetical protein
MSDELVALAPPLRLTWFTTLADSLEQALPGAWEALSMAAVEITDEGQLSVRIPDVYPVSKPVHKEVHRMVTDILQGLLGSDMPCVVKFTARAPRPVRKQPTGLDVHHWGDPPPDSWAALSSGLIAAIGTMEEPAREVLGKAHVAAVSQRAVWLCFPTVEARRAVGKTPGVAYALTMAAKEQLPGSFVALYAAGA